MSQISQSWKPRLRASRLACANSSRVSVWTLTSCGDSRPGTEVVGTFMAGLLYPLILVGAAAIPERELHRPEPQRPQQLRDRGQNLGCGHGVDVFPDDGCKCPFFAVGFRDIKADRGGQQLSDG